MELLLTFWGHRSLHSLAMLCLLFTHSKAMVGRGPNPDLLWAGQCFCWESFRVWKPHRWSARSISASHYELWAHFFCWREEKCTLFCFTGLLWSKPMEGLDNGRASVISDDAIWWYLWCWFRHLKLFECRLQYDCCVDVTAQCDTFYNLWRHFQLCCTQDGSR